MRASIFRWQALAVFAALAEGTFGASAQDAGSSHAALLPVNLSPWGMFMNADIVVKAVMVGLAFASLVTWTIWLYKTIELFGARRRAENSLVDVVHSQSLKDAAQIMGKRGDPSALLVRAASEELELSDFVVDHTGGDGLKERVSSRLARIEARAGRRMTRGTGLIATIGATAPFVGLFGTVWGIMNAFIGISEAQTTNLAVVAPGIAEALFATALGLMAAIPAVVFYNKFSADAAQISQRLEVFADEFAAIVSRQIDVRT